MPKTAKQEVGQIGEDIAVKHFVKHSFRILDRNYRKPWGEVDIIVKKDNILHFIEVKTVTHETNTIGQNAVEEKNPEENVHPWKCRRLSRVIQTYLIEKRISDETEWQVDVAAVFLDMKTRKAKIRITENILL